MTAKQAIHEMMRQTSLARSVASRAKGGRKAWQTRVENLQVKLEKLKAGAKPRQ